MPPFRSHTSNHVSRPSPLGGGERNSTITTTLLADGQTVQDGGQHNHNHQHPSMTLSGGPSARSARSQHHGLFGSNSRLMFQGGTNHFTIQQIYNEGIDVPNTLSGQGLFGSGSQVLLSGGYTTFQQDTHMHHHDHIHYSDGMYFFPSIMVQ
ncbi:hypothetical protein BJ165DRAFT_1483810 [Panaeolus papilionaceus]|nr:hypothetical protein BJ165DRAFT_1483810 [Panaeolus papilionaceus]